MAIRTIFSMVEDCARGERQGWYEFARDYAAIARSLLQQYFPTLNPELDSHVGFVFERARANDNQWVRDLRFQNERELLMSFRQLVFAYGREQARVPAPEISLEQMRQIMRDLTVVQRELLWLFVKGYDAPRIAAVMMNADVTANDLKRVADERLGQILPGASPEAFNVSARVLIEAAEKTAGEHCLPWKTFNNLINGQISWRERELAEKHIGDCFNCIDRFTSFQEMIRYRKDAQPASEAEIESILARLNLPGAKSKGLFAKLFASR
jgi:hypothetical protein